MHPHPTLQLSIHATHELEHVLEEQIVVREQLHAWPLSSVESLITASGTRFIYKVQCEPTVEPEFYQRVHSRLLPACAVLQRDARQAVLLLAYIQAPTLRTRNLDEQAAVRHGRDVVRQIGEIRADVPVYADLGTVKAWRAFAQKTLDMLSTLIGDGRFKNINRDDVGALARWAETQAVLDVVDRTSRTINGDLKAEHIFCLADGYQLIDWQRPYRAPGDIDLVTYLDSLQIPAQGHVAPAVFGLRWFLFVHWAAEAKLNLLPQLPVFDTWARSGIDKIRSVAG